MMLKQLGLGGIAAGLMGFVTWGYIAIESGNREIEVAAAIAAKCEDELKIARRQSANLKRDRDYAVNRIERAETHARSASAAAMDAKIELSRIQSHVEQFKAQKDKLAAEIADLKATPPPTEVKPKRVKAVKAVKRAGQRPSKSGRKEVARRTTHDWFW